MSLLAPYILFPAAASGITIEASDSGTIAAGGGSSSVTIPGTPAENDYVFLFTCCDNEPTEPSGYTEVGTDPSAENPGGYVVYKIMGASPDSTVSVPQHSGRIIAYVIALIRGVDTSTPLGNTPTWNNSTTGLPDGNSHTTLNDGALRLLVGFLDDDDTALTVPSGFTLLDSQETGAGSGPGASICVGYILDEAASTANDPDAFGGSGDDGWKCCHFDLNEA
jgi:hypothetical protein